MAEIVLQEGFQLQNGKYKILGLLGQGGFGITYEAEMVSTGQKVAIKEFFMKDACERLGETAAVTVPTASNRALVERFRKKFIREAKLIASMRNSHIVKIYDIFEENQTAYYVMEIYQGGSLNSLVKIDGPLPENAAIGYIKQIGEALSYIHGRNVLHLDVKPANILISNDRAVLIDFGISKHYDETGSQTSTTPVGITPGYAPFEQYHAGDISKFTPATDIYSLGATLYFLVTGQDPMPASEIIADGGLTRPKGVSNKVWAAISAAMSPRVQDRPKSAQAFLKILGVSLDESTVAVNALSSRDKIKKQWKKPFWISLILGAVVAIAISLILAGKRSLPEEELAEISDQPLPAETTVVNESVKPVKEALFELEITSNPSGAKVFLNGKDCKLTTPAHLKELKTGTYKITLKMDGYEDFTKTVSFKKDDKENQILSLNLSKVTDAEVASVPVYHDIQIDSSPSGATVKVNGTYKGETPLKIKDIADGKYEVTINLNGYLPQTKTVTLNKESTNPYTFSFILEKEPAKMGSVNGHDWVNLGLSVKWATCNVGASSPEANGNYYAWGETSTKNNYDRGNYKYSSLWDDFDYCRLTKYNTTESETQIDNKTTLDYNDDIARISWGGGWRMPTEKEMKELMKQCDWVLDTQNGHKGYVITGPNGNSIFLPCAGYMDGKKLYGKDKTIHYWSSSLDSGYSINAICLSGGNSSPIWRTGLRFYGFSVRPILE